MIKHCCDYCYKDINKTNTVILGFECSMYSKEYELCDDCAKKFIEKIEYQNERLLNNLNEKFNTSLLEIEYEQNKENVKLFIDYLKSHCFTRYDFIFEDFKKHEKDIFCGNFVPSGMMYYDYYRCIENYPIIIKELKLKNVTDDNKN